MSSATSGRSREHRASRHLQDHGWVQIMRAAGSKGPADLLMGHPVHGAALVQVGTGNKTLGPADRTRLLDAATLCGAIPLLCQVIEARGYPTEYMLWVVSEGPASTWDRWTP